VHNTAANGGGLSNAGSGNLTLRDSKVQFNTANGGNGGGIDNTATLQVLESRISDNRTGTAVANVGGGLHQGSTGTTTIRRSTLTRNAAGDGGAIFETTGGTVTVFKSLITNNHPNNCRPVGNVPGCLG
jgi:hypothetical protein